jgi:transposase
MNRYPGVNSILVCDNVRIHGGPRVQALCDEVGVLLEYLPPYCPELNPIELCFAALKSDLRHTQILSSSIEPEWDIRLTFARVVTADLIYKLYKHCGYSVPNPQIN